MSKNAKSPSEGGPPRGQAQLSKLWWSARHPPAPVTASFKGKTVLVTGANTGLGFEAAVKYATLGASTLILTVRSAAKGEEAKTKILQRSGRTDDFIVILTVDMSTLSAVKDFVQQLDSRVPYLDVALLNAGVAPPGFTKSPAGYEMALQVNVLSSALMAILLLPKLRTTAAAPGRGPVHLSFVNSVSHIDVEPAWFAGRSLFAATNDEATWDARKSYGMVKLLAMAVMQKLALTGQNVIVNSNCPSMCKTDLGRDWPLGPKIFMTGFQAVFARTAEEGARTLVSATTLGPESNGKFWSHDILHPMGELVDDEKVMNEAWNDILQILEKEIPDVGKIVMG